MNPVLVVGAGPVGLTMAAELARYRVPVRIVEKVTARTDKSKALVVWSRTLELLERAGCARNFVAAGRQAHGTDIRSGTNLIAHVTLDSVASDFPYALMLPQSETERLLEEHLQALGVTVERGVTSSGFTDMGEGVSCTVRHGDGHDETFDASWLIGCDGAHSSVRHQLGMAFDGDTIPSTFILADVHVAGLDIAQAEIMIFFHRTGMLAFFPIAGDRYRVMADMGDTPRHDPTLAETQAIVDERGPGGLGLSDPVWLTGFSVNERKVRDFRAGRVFLAGDAAHVHSPAGGQGMNTGMQDAFNLAWKLALVVRGTARAAGVLDSYSIERTVVAAQVLKDSGRLLRMAMVQNPVGQSVRNFVAHHVFGLSAVRHAVADKLSEVSIGYPDSPLNGEAAKGVHGPAAGERIVAGAPFGAGDTPRFALCARPGEAATRMLGEFPDLLEPQARPALREGGAWLVRPDGYVSTVARDGDLSPLARQLSALRTEPK